MKSNSKKDKSLISRKKFIKNAALGTAGFSIVPRHVLGGKDFVAPSDKLYIASIGVGGEAGGFDTRRISKNPKKNAEIAFLCDVDSRLAAPRKKEFPKAKFYYDWREMFEKEHKNFDAVTIAVPDHNHAIIGLEAMKLHKHLYLEKPLTHDVYEARVLTEAAKKYNVVTQMGDQNASCDGMRTLKEWLEAGVIGDIQKVYNWTDRPVWPQGIPWPKKSSPIPDGLQWDLWLGTAKKIDYVDNVVPFNWRGWWQFGTGALGDMGDHIMGPAFKLLGLGSPKEITCSASTSYSGDWEESHYPRSIPRASKIRYTFELEDGKELPFYWMDGGIVPDRPDELDPEENMNEALADMPEENDYEGGSLIVGTEGKISYGWGGKNPRLLPLSLNKEVDISEKYPRVNGGKIGHYWQWVDAAIAGYGNDYEGNAAITGPGQNEAQVDSPFVEYGGPLTEMVLAGNLLLRSFNIREDASKNNSIVANNSDYAYPHRYKSYKWDGDNMKFTNLEFPNKFVKREYREGWGQVELKNI